MDVSKSMGAEPAVSRSARIPRLGLHGPSGQWRVVIDGKSHYLGSDRTEARRRYDALIAQWLPERRLPDGKKAVALVSGPLTVADVGAKFIEAHKTYFV